MATETKLDKVNWARQTDMGDFRYNKIYSPYPLAEYSHEFKMTMKKGVPLIANYWFRIESQQSNKDFTNSAFSLISQFYPHPITITVEDQNITLCPLNSIVDTKNIICGRLEYELYIEDTLARKDDVTGLENPIEEGILIDNEISDGSKIILIESNIRSNSTHVWRILDMWKSKA